MAGIKRRIDKLERQAAKDVEGKRGIPFAWLYDWGCWVPDFAFEKSYDKTESLGVFYERIREAERLIREHEKEKDGGKPTVQTWQ